MDRFIDLSDWSWVVKRYEGVVYNDYDFDNNKSVHIGLKKYSDLGVGTLDRINNQTNKGYSGLQIKIVSPQLLIVWGITSMC